jgi:hypothetical protein
MASQATANQPEALHLGVVATMSQDPGVQARSFMLLDSADHALGSGSLVAAKMAMSVVIVILAHKMKSRTARR